MQVENFTEDITPDILPDNEIRCNDYYCPIKIYCARYEQLLIDYANCKTDMIEENYKGSENRRLCNYFINKEIE